LFSKTIPLRTAGSTGHLGKQRMRILQCGARTIRSVAATNQSGSRVWVLGSFTIRLQPSGRGRRTVPVFACSVGAQVGFAVGFHWCVDPRVGKSYAAYAPPAYQPPTSRAPTSRPPAAAIAGPSAVVAPAASPIVPEQARVAAAFAALPDAAEKTAAEKT